MRTSAELNEMIEKLHAERDATIAAERAMTAEERLEVDVLSRLLPLLNDSESCRVVTRRIEKLQNRALERE